MKCVCDASMSSFLTSFYQGRFLNFTLTQLQLSEVKDTDCCLTVFYLPLQQRLLFYPFLELLKIYSLLHFSHFQWQQQILIWHLIIYESTQTDRQTNCKHQREKENPAVPIWQFGPSSFSLFFSWTRLNSLASIFGRCQCNDLFSVCTLFSATGPHADASFVPAPAKFLWELKSNRLWCCWCVGVHRVLSAASKPQL